MKFNLKRMLPLIVATLIFLNGLINILFSILPVNFFNEIYISEAAKFISYTSYYQQASSILSIIIGLVLISLSLGLYRKQRNAWYWSIAILFILNIGNIYPAIELVPLILGLFSLFVLLSFYRYFPVRRRTTQTHIIIAWISVIFAMAYGSIGSYLMRAQFKGIHNFIDAVYYTLVTYSTVGYGDITPLNSDAKLFVITMILVGLAAFATVVTVLLGPMLERRLKKVFTMVEHLNHLRNHVILCGVNQITIQMAKDLKKKNLGILFFDHRQDELAKMDQLDFETLMGDPADKRLLKQAGLSDAKLIICGLESDAQNVLLAMTLKDIISSLRSKKKAKIITLIENPSNADNARKSGADDVIMPAVLGSQCVQNLIVS